MKCLFCNTEFDIRYPTQKYCRPNHARQASKKRKRLGIAPIEYRKNCVICSSEFVTLSPSSICCSKKCSEIRATAHNRRPGRYLSRRGRCFEYVYQIKVEKGCSRCPEKRPNCLQFHHLDPASKIATISKLVTKRSFDMLKKEIDKCIILCANCHAVEETGDGYKDQDRPKGNQ